MVLIAVVAFSVSRLIMSAIKASALRASRSSLERTVSGKSTRFSVTMMVARAFSAAAATWMSVLSGRSAQTGSKRSKSVTIASWKAASIARRARAARSFGSARSLPLAIFSMARSVSSRMAFDHLRRKSSASASVNRRLRLRTPASVQASTRAVVPTRGTVRASPHRVRPRYQALTFASHPGFSCRQTRRPLLSAGGAPRVHTRSLPGRAARSKTGAKH